MVALLNAKRRFPDLSDANVTRGYAMPYGPPLPAVEHRRPPPVVEVAFDRYREDAMVVERIAVSGRSAVYVTSDYTRWGPTSVRAVKLLETALEVIGSPGVAALTVRYTDLFRGDFIDGKITHPLVLFRPGSEMIVSSALTSEDFFHSHTGFFKKLHSGERALFNCDIELTGSNDARSLSIMTSVKVFVTEGTGLVPGAANRPPLPKLADMAHISCKEVLYSLLADPVCALIGLKVT